MPTPNQINRWIDRQLLTETVRLSQLKPSRLVTTNEKQELWNLFHTAEGMRQERITSYNKIQELEKL